MKDTRLKEAEDYINSNEDKIITTVPLGVKRTEIFVKDGFALEVKKGKDGRYNVMGHEPAVEHFANNTIEKPNNNYEIGDIITDHLRNGVQYLVISRGLETIKAVPLGSLKDVKEISIDTGRQFFKLYNLPA